MQKYVRGVRISCFPPPHETCKTFTLMSIRECKRALLHTSGVGSNPKDMQRIMSDSGYLF